jgi:hypothetical protein
MPKHKYNYRRFAPENYDYANPSGLSVGEYLPDVKLHTLTGEHMRLSDYNGKTLVLETGSLSCPLYIGKIKRMNAVARAFPDVIFIVVYIRVALPGSKIPNHSDTKTKITNANRLGQSEPENRTILIDTYDGDLHKALGLLPNMAYVIAPDHSVIYRADWNIPGRIFDVLKALKDGTHIPTQKANFTPVPPHYSVRVLGRAGGLRAIWAFISHLPELIKQHRLSK